MGTFISILLLVLKILGIVLLSVLGVLLILLFLVLFVPIRYLAKGSYAEREAGLVAKATYLMHIVSISFDLSRQEKLKIKIFGIQLGKKKKENRDKDSSPTDEENKSNVDAEPKDIENCDYDEPADDDADKELFEDSDDICKELSEDTSVENETSLFDELPGEEVEGTVIFDDEEEKKSSEQQRPEREKRNKSNSHKSEVYDKIKKYLEVMDTVAFQTSYDLCKKQIGKIFKAVLPKKWKVEGKVGFEDPSLTGKACIGLSLLYPWTYKNLFITCDFEEEIIEVSGYCKGRIYGISLLIVFLRVFFSRNIRRTLKMFKE